MGFHPSAPPVKLCSTVSFPVVSSLNRTPHPPRCGHARSPPELVVPYRLPAGSRSKPPHGLLPSDPEKLCSTVALPVVSSLKTTPHPPAHIVEPPPRFVAPYRLPVASLSRLVG